MAARVINALMRVRSPFKPLRSFHSSTCLLSSEADVKRVEDEDDIRLEDVTHDTTKRQHYKADIINDEPLTRSINWNEDRKPRAGFNRWTDDKEVYSQYTKHKFVGQNPGFKPKVSDDFGFDSSVPVDTPAYDPNLKKDVYDEDAKTADRTEEDIQNFYTENKITVIGSNDLKPILSFDELTNMDKFQRRSKESGWTEPFPIQSVTWPIAMSGKDMVGIAQTGSGKTLGFVLPAILHIMKKRSKLASRSYNIEPTVLVMTPTRELTQQVKKVVSEVGRDYGIHCGCAFGGSGMKNQLSELRGADICIATPGRLNDYLSRGVVSLKKCSYVVLDEADRMLDMGFEVQIRQILRYVKPNRQMLMWSATWPREIQHLAAAYLSKPVQIRIGSMDLMTNPNISESFILATEKDKFSKLCTLLGDIATSYPDECKTLVFTQRKKTADELSESLMRQGIPSFALHGDKNQAQRDQIMDLFRRRKKILLIATDIASRGIDVADISNVVNYDMPSDAESYVHRIGRTARGGRKGKAFSLVTTEDFSVLKALVAMFKQHKKKVPPQLYELIKADRGYNFGGGKRRYRSLAGPTKVNPLWEE
ncbi:ATP-dependent RNA helicase dbp2-like [Pecten maximus]|uniref:ATP-dependent RNA helicase dbp2-like n=1 Tax=Pecten maximus TaxID=6579 RepID=UPI00145889C3|nr:ATP-dependent RNA helicase dbp2-like [Pecten maximus]